MPSKFIRAYAHGNRAIVNGDCSVVNSYFRLLKLAAGQSERFTLDTFECVAVVMSGSADIVVAGELFAAVGKRRDFWSGKADSV